ncbi:hypothetical protein AB4Z48_05490 [Cupriavidus sp. 2TAF22]|uniref:hypothetical protein n=1 Tax=unclassified Cupriavidus TaxID=2640874 RepID=UPI003F91CD55
MSPEFPSAVPPAPHKPPSEDASSAAGSYPHIRLATAADAPALSDWLQAARPLPVAAARARSALVESLLARPERGACVVAEAAGQQVLGCLPVTLVPHLGLAGLAAFVAEWWARPVAETGTAAVANAALFQGCCDLLADWCRAHGVRHLLLSPALLTVRQAEAAGFVPCAGLWHCNLAPAHKDLG